MYILNWRMQAVRVSNMTKVSRKSTEERRTKYLQFKSYHSNNVAPFSRLLSRSIPGARKNENVATTSRTVFQKFLPGETIGSANGLNREPNFVGVSPTLYKRLKAELEKLKLDQSTWTREKLDLEKTNAELTATNENLQSKIVMLQRENESFSDMLDANNDTISYLTFSNEKQANELKEFESSVVDLRLQKDATLNRLQQMEDENQELKQLLSELKRASEEKDRTVEALNGFKQKSESYKSKLEAIVTEKEDLAAKLLDNQKYVTFLERDVHELQDKNQELKEKTETMTKIVSDKKKIEERLRQKYDELKKINKSFSEREAKCLIHSGIGMSGKHPTVEPMSSLFEKVVTDRKDVISLKIIPSYLDDRSNRSKNAGDQMHQVLHKRTRLEIQAGAKKN